MDNLNKAIACAAIITICIIMMLGITFYSTAKVEKRAHKNYVIISEIKR